MRAQIPRTVLIILLAGLLLPSACAGEINRAILPSTDQYVNGNILVNPEWLQQNIDAQNVLVIDMRSPDEYPLAHIQGAVNVPIGDITSTVDGVGFEFDLEEVQETLNRIGLQPDMTVVIYDDLGMMNSGRLFWTLEYIGHPDVRVLHGGWNAWIAAGYMVSNLTPEVAPSEYPIDIDPSRLATAEAILQALDDPDVAIVDSRSPEEYSGEITYADRGGHIPGAINLPWLNVLTGGSAISTTQDGWQEALQDEDVESFKTATEIQRILDSHGIRRDQEVITYCQTLWRGAHTYFLLRLMGYENVRGYDGSWAEWGNRPDLPVVKGSQPGDLDMAD